MTFKSDTKGTTSVNHITRSPPGGPYDLRTVGATLVVYNSTATVVEPRSSIFLRPDGLRPPLSPVQEYHDDPTTGAPVPISQANLKQNKIAPRAGGRLGVYARRAVAGTRRRRFTIDKTDFCSDPPVKTAASSNDKVDKFVAAVLQQGRDRLVRVSP